MLNILSNPLIILYDTISGNRSMLRLYYAISAKRASYIKSIYASHISLYSMRASLSRIIYKRILGWVIEDAYNGNRRFL